MMPRRAIPPPYYGDANFERIIREIHDHAVSDLDDYPEVMTAVLEMLQATFAPILVPPVTDDLDDDSFSTVSMGQPPTEV